MLGTGAPDTVGTCGTFEVKPGAVNSVPRHARLGIGGWFEYTQWVVGGGGTCKMLLLLRCNNLVCCGSAPLTQSTYIACACAAPLQLDPAMSGGEGAGLGFDLLRVHYTTSSGTGVWVRLEIVLFI